MALDAWLESLVSPFKWLSLSLMKLDKLDTVIILSNRDNAPSAITIVPKATPPTYAHCIHSGSELVGIVSP